MIQKASRFVREASVIIVGTGAGMGIDSGLPDFRGNQGFWNNYPPYRGKFNFMECANPQFLQTNPHLFWGFYGSRLAMYRQKHPHKGYTLLKQLAKLISNKDSEDNIFAVTSNVDGHFFRANYPQNRVLQVHGSINHLQCACPTLSQNDFVPEVNYEEMSSINLPRCQKCGQFMRPNILMFDDWGWRSQRSDLQQKDYYTFLKQNKDKKIAIIQIGAGTTVPTIRNMMQQLIYDNKNTKMIRINPEKGISSSRWIGEQRYVDVNLSALQGIQKIKQSLV